MSNLANTIEGILFYEADSLTIAEICELTGESEDNVVSALKEIEAIYSDTNKSITLLNHKDSYQLVLSGDARNIITLRDEKEREGELSRAALETLSCILYLGNASKSQIDYIRGVQSGYMLRTLASRGLIARVGKSGRDTKYTTTVETLRFMGINRPEDMPDYENISAEFMRVIDNNKTDLE